MSNKVIIAENVVKTYPLYSKPRDRFLDMLGLLRRRPPEHIAINGISFTVDEGERVAIIGRNGAGKSTLLKLITGVTSPTSGSLLVSGETQALLQIGTGFHPEFTGRQNVYSYLGHLGLSGAAADKALADIIDFAEVEDYIDQPIKTYSTGMSMRLMFAASTAITPDVLVIDEVLSVGDAYFSNKSMNKIKEITSKKGSTLLLVSHDIYGASKICDRMIWIDRGQIIVDGKSKIVIRAYEDAIRLQEEARLRKKVLLLEKARAQNPQRTIIIEFCSAGNRPLDDVVYFANVTLHAGENIKSVRLFGGEGERDSGSAGVLLEGSAWGDATAWRDRSARPMRNYGSPFHKVAVIFKVPDECWERGPNLIKVDLGSDKDFRLEVVMFDEGVHRRLIGEVVQSGGSWESHSYAIQEAARGDEAPQHLVSHHGSGGIVVSGVVVLDANMQESFVLAHMKPAKFIINFKINIPTMDETCDVGLAFMRDGVSTACRVRTNDLKFSTKNSREGDVTLEFKKFPLENGRYSVALIIARQGYYRDNSGEFFSISPSVYALYPEICEIRVVMGDLYSEGANVIVEGDWRISSSADEGAAAAQK